MAAKQVAVVIRIAAVFVIVAIAVVAFAVARSYRQKRDAERFLTVLSAIPVGANVHEQIDRDTKQFEDVKREYNSQNRREVEYTFSNMAMHSLRLAPYTEFRAIIAIENGIVVEKRATESVPTLRCAATVIERTRTQEDSEDKRPSHFVVGEGASSKQIIITDDDSYNAEGRTSDWRFDLSCLTKLMGCQDPRQFLRADHPLRVR